jgi:uncharacterized protein YkwD
VERTPRTLTTLVVVVSIALSLTAPAASGHGGRLDVAIIRRINALRSAYGLQPLRRSRELAVAARHHSLEMASGGYFSHSSPDGGGFAGRVREWYRVAGRGWAVGENLLWASPTVRGLQTVELWLASPAHRANLLAPRWRDVGCAAVHAADAPGVYGDQPVTVVTCDFGRRG